MSDKTSVIRGPKDLLTKTRNATRSMTTGTLVATLPKGSRIVAFVLSGVASTAGTSATLSIGSTTTATEFVNAHDVKTAATGAGVVVMNGVAGGVGSVLTVDTPIYFKYAESGTASGAGAWKIHVVYTVGNAINDTTI